MTQPPDIEYSVDPNLVTTLAPHIEDGDEPCWCKKRVDVTLNGKKVGTALTDHEGVMTVRVEDESFAKAINITPQHGHYSIATPLEV
jgi:hypothetical protein